MSYITPPYDNVSSRAGLSSNQIDKIKFSANTPMRQLLRNYCLGTELCEESEEIECTPGDTQPAEDGCNTCSCNSEGVWICTLKGCLDDNIKTDDNNTIGIIDGDGGSIPGLGLPALISLLAIVAIIRRRQNEN